MININIFYIYHLSKRKHYHITEEPLAETSHIMLKYDIAP